MPFRGKASSAGRVNDSDTPLGFPLQLRERDIKFNSVGCVGYCGIMIAVREYWIELPQNKCKSLAVISDITDAPSYTSLSSKLLLIIY
jgi:hypothetical protein